MAEVENKEEVVVPRISDPTWSDYVLSHLTPDELVDGHPKTDGLRRLVEKFIGEIVDMNCVVIQCPNVDNLNRAVVTCRLTVQKPVGGDRAIFSGSADACTQNADPPYNMYPTAIAETRAFGRSLRNALRIKTAVAEELSQNAVHSADTNDSHIKISQSQIKGIDSQCKKLNINVEKFANAGDFKYKNIKEVALNRATGMLKLLSQHERDENKVVPESYAGYDANWKSYFLGE